MTDWRNVHSILFVCHGNICRSVMAHFVMAKLLAKAGRRDIFVDSAGTSAEELGNPVYPPAAAELRRHEVPLLPHRARQLCAEDATKFDVIVAADERNLANIRRMLGEAVDGKCYMLMEFDGKKRGIADPWYTDDFDAAWKDVLAGCQALMRLLLGGG